MVRDIPAARYVMQGLQALAWTKKQQIGGLDGGEDDLRDIPLGWILPQQEIMQELLLDDREDLENVGGELAAPSFNVECSFDRLVKSCVSVFLRFPCQ